PGLLNFCVFGSAQRRGQLLAESSPKLSKLIVDESSHVYVHSSLVVDLFEAKFVWIDHQIDVNRTLVLLRGLVQQHRFQLDVAAGERRFDRGEQLLLLCRRSRRGFFLARQIAASRVDLEPVTLYFYFDLAKVAVEPAVGWRVAQK